jgi:hypothetical protein
MSLQRAEASALPARALYHANNLRNYRSSRSYRLPQQPE